EPRMAGTQPTAIESPYEDVYRQLDLFGDVFERVREQYVEEKVRRVSAGSKTTIKSDYLIPSFKQILWDESKK
ncbi:MAG: hypothetical protein ACPGSB_06535, partial [Opitutales bacterium]